MTGRMRIAILVHRIGPYHDARFRAARRECDLAIVEYSSVDDTYRWESVRADEYPVTSLFTDADAGSKAPGEVAARMARALQAIAPDVVAIPGWSSPASVAALGWCAKSAIPAVVLSESTEHDERRRLPKEWVKSRLVRLFSAAVVGGTPHVAYVVKLGLPRSRVFTGYDVVDNAYFISGTDRARAKAAEVRRLRNLPERYFLASSRFVGKKNLERLVAAYAAYAGRAGAGAWHLVLLGDGERKAPLQGMVAASGLADRVHFPGFMQYGDLPDYYGLASAFVHASTVEQWGLVVNEAMASALPVLVSDRCGCAPDLVREGVNGFAFDPLDVEVLARRMADFASGAYDLVTMGRAGREMILQFGPESFARNVCAAASVALSLPARRAGAIDRALLWAVARR